MEDLSDQQLLHRCAEGHADALRALYARYGASVYGLAVSMVRDAGVAEEITQDTFLRVWRAAGAYTEQGRFPAWLLRITRRLALDVLRLRKPKTAASDDAMMQLPNQEPDPEQQVLARWEASRVRQALMRLPAEQQQVVWLSFYQGLSQQEIASLLHMPLGTVKGRMRLAYRALQQSLGAKESEVR